MGVRDPQQQKPEERVATMAARQHGLVTRRQLLACRLTPEMIKTRLRNGFLVRVLPGVYRVAAVPQTWRQTVLAAVLWGGDSAVASHGTAAKLWGLPVTPSQIEITLPTSRSPVRNDIRIHKGRIASREAIDGIPVASASRTLLDLANRVDAGTLETLVDHALSRKLVTPASLEWELRLSGGPGRYGTKCLRAAIAHLNEGHCESPLENKVLRTLLKAGLPSPIRQHEICDAEGFVARVDFAYPSAKLAIEVDGYRYHSGPKSFHQDRRRDARLSALEWLVIRVSDRSLSEKAFIEAVEKRLRSRLF